MGVNTVTIHNSSLIKNIYGVPIDTHLSLEIDELSQWPCKVGTIAVPILWLKKRRCR